MIVVGLHTRLDFTANGGAQLTAQRALLETESGKVNASRTPARLTRRRPPHHSFAPFDFLDDRFHVEVTEFGS